MKTETIMHVRLATKDKEFINDVVKEGYFSNRSAALRSGLHLLEFSLLSDELKRVMRKELRFEETMKALKKARKEAYHMHWK